MSYIPLSRSCYHTTRAAQLHDVTQEHYGGLGKILSIPHQWIEEGKLLAAHHSLVNLENSRDDLLFKLHRVGHNNTRDRDLLKEYFEAVNDLSNK